jgi:O-antigen biosynthesis protein WbqP
MTTFRICDLLLITLLAPVAVIVVLIASIPNLFSGHSIFFVQNRVGRYGQRFRLIKIRTMIPGVEVARTNLLNDAVITRSGRILRRLKVDELPQFINVLKGEMSLVGPRPGLVEDHELFNLRSKSGLLDVLPGVTGYAQVWGVDMSDVQKLVSFDQYLVKHMCLRMYLFCLLSTVMPVFKRAFQHSAYDR